MTAFEEFKLRHPCREIRTIDYDDLKELCRQNQWYASGNDDAFGELLLGSNGELRQNITTDDLFEMAYMILENNDPYLISADGEISIADMLRHIMHELLTITKTTIKVRSTRNALSS